MSGSNPTDTLTTSWTTSTLCFDQVMVLSLPFRRCRRHQVSAHLGAENISFQIVDARHGPYIDRSALPEHIISSQSKVHLSSGSLGCLLTHIDAWKRVLDYDLSFVLVLEDDVVPRRLCRKQIFSLAKKIPKDCDFLFLGSKSLARWNIKRPIYSSLVELSHFVRGAYSYAVTSTGVKKMFATAFPVALTCGGVDDLIGVALRRSIINVYHAQPSFFQVNYCHLSDIYNRYDQGKTLTPTAFNDARLR